MDYIPFPIHIAVLTALWIFAGIRGGPFPFKLVSLYSAFFILCAGSQKLVEAGSIDYSVQILLQFVTTLFLFDLAIEAPRLKYIKRFCAIMILSIINYAFMFISFITFEGIAYDYASNIYSAILFWLSIAVIWILIGVINGSSRGDSIFIGLYRSLYNGFMHFRLHKEALSPSIWEKGQKIEYRTAEQR